MVNAHEVQQRGLEVVDMNGFVGDVVAELIRFAVDDAGLHTAARHPNRETARVMVAPESCC